VGRTWPGSPARTRRGDVDEALPVAGEVAAEVAGRVELGVVAGLDAFLCGGVVVAGRADLDVADDVVAALVQRRDRGRGVLDAVDVVDNRVVPGRQVTVVGGDPGRPAGTSTATPAPASVAGTAMAQPPTRSPATLLPPSRPRAELPVLSPVIRGLASYPFDLHIHGSRGGSCRLTRRTATQGRPSAEAVRPRMCK